MTTWDTSLVRAAKDAHLAGAVLGVLAYLAADDIPHDLLLAPNAANEPLLDGGDELAVSEAIAALARYSLIDATRDASGSITALSTHRLVQDVTRIRHATPTDVWDDVVRWCGSAVRLLRAAFPEDPIDPTVWPTAQRFAPHVMAVARHAEPHDVEPENVSWLLDRYALYLQRSGTPLAAPPVFERALGIDQRVHGDDHPETLAARHNLARSYWSVGRTIDAIPLEESVLTDRERILGPDHPDTLIARQTLSEWSAADG